MTEVVIRDDAPVSQPVRPIERRGGVEYVGGTNIPTAAVYTAYMALRDGQPDATLHRYLDLTPEQTAFAIRYEAKKAKRKDPIRRQLKANGRACRNRGRDFEKLVTARIARFGFKRVPGSGMFGGSLSGDIRRECTYLTLRRDDGVTWSNGPASVRKIECKRQEAEQRFVRAALAQGGGSQVVVIGKPGIEPIAYMELAQLEHLLREAGYEVTG